MFTERSKNAEQYRRRLKYTSGNERTREMENKRRKANRETIKNEKESESQEMKRAKEKWRIRENPDV